jgi:dolichyl-phosphate-mannose-protein mannosyltransferase
MNEKRTWVLAAVLLGIAAYLVLFYATELPGLPNADGWSHRRIIFLLPLLTPDDSVAQWLGTSPAVALLDRLPVAAVAGGILGGSFVIGWLALALGGLDRRLRGLEVTVFSLAVGLNGVSTYVLLAGLFGLLHCRSVFLLPMVLISAAAGWLWFRRRGEPSDGNLSPPSPTHDDLADDQGIGPRWLWCAAPFVAVIVLGGMLPPAEFDVREYHLQAPKEFFEAGRIGFLPHNLYGNMALGTEMFSLLGMVLTGDWWLGSLVGKTVIAAFGPLTGLGLLAAGRRFFSPSVGIVAAVLFVSTPWIVQVSTTGFVEGASALYLLMTLYAFWLWQKSPDRSPMLLALCGYMAGSAVSCKYPGVLFVVLPFAAGIALMDFEKIESGKADGRKRRPRSSSSSPRGLPAVSRHLTVFFLAVGIGCGLWFAKNWTFTGNPTYPLMYGLFGGENWSAEKTQTWNKVHVPTDFSVSALRHDMAGVVLKSKWLSPILMPLAVLALIRPKTRRFAIWLAVYFAFIVAVWWCMALRSADRYWIHGLPLVALLGGIGACWCQERVWRRALLGILVFGTVVNLAVVTSGGGGYNRYFASLAELRVVPDRVDAWHLYFNRHATEGRVLLVGEAQVFDIEVPILYNTWLDDSIFERMVIDPATGKLRQPKEIRSAFQAENVSYVYVHWGEIARYRATGYNDFALIGPELFDTLVKQGILAPIPPTRELEKHSGRGYRVLKASEPVVGGSPDPPNVGHNNRSER